MDEAFERFAQENTGLVRRVDATKALGTDESIDATSNSGDSTDEEVDLQVLFPTLYQTTTLAKPRVHVETTGKGILLHSERLPNGGRVTWEYPAGDKVVGDEGHVTHKDGRSSDTGDGGEVSDP